MLTLRARSPEDDDRSIVLCADSDPQYDKCIVWVKFTIGWYNVITITLVKTMNHITLYLMFCLFIQNNPTLMVTGHTPHVAVLMLMPIDQEQMHESLRK